MGSIVVPWYFFLIQAFVLMALIITKKSSNRKRLPLPPGPYGWPVIGHTLEMFRNRPTPRWIHRIMKEMNTEIACFRFGFSFHVIAVTSDEIAREVLKEKDSIFASRPKSFISETVTMGYKAAIFTPYGDRWKKMRRVLVSELNSSRVLNLLHGARIAEADSLLAYVRTLYEDSKLVNIRFVTRHYCQSLTMRLMFNKRYFDEAAAPNGGPGDRDIEHVEAIFTCLANIYSFRISDYFPCLRSFYLDNQEKLVKEASDIIKKLHKPIIDERIQKWRNADGGSKQVQDWLDILITLKDADGMPLLTTGEIKAQTMEIMLAAIDNSSNNVEWALAEMLNQPEILRKATEELDIVVGKERLVQESDIPNLNYIKACSREAFRMHPIAPFLPTHVALSDTTLAGYFIPKGSHVHISRTELARNPKIWDDPHTFNPERHLNTVGPDGEVSLTEPDMRFVSFGTGRRGCIATKLGTWMTVMLLARLIQGFTWSLSEPGQVDLTESLHDMVMAKPLVARGEPRLSPDLYPRVKSDM